MSEKQRTASGKSGGQRIDDHAFFGGSSPKGKVFPEGNKTKEYTSAEGAGSELEYEDTTEMIKSQQNKGIDKAKARPLKTTYRN